MKALFHPVRLAAAALSLGAGLGLCAPPATAASVKPGVVYTFPASYYVTSLIGPMVEGADGLIYISTWQSSGLPCGELLTLRPASKVVLALPLEAVGCRPSMSLAKDASGNLWGTTHGVYPSQYGSLFRIPPNGAPTPVYAFTSADGFKGGPVPAPWTGARIMLSEEYIPIGYDGQIESFTPPYYLPVQFRLMRFYLDAVRPPFTLMARRQPSADTALYGLAFTGYGNNPQTAFVKIDELGNLSVLAKVGLCSEVQAELTEGTDGFFYANCYSGGPNRLGTVVRLSPSGAKTTIRTFVGGNSGDGPDGGVLHASDGWLYGSTSTGGAGNMGVIYRMRTNGSNYEVLFNFTGANLGRNPSTAFLQAADGKIYGRSQFGAANNAGVIFRFAPPPP